MITAQDKLEIELAMAELGDARRDMREFLASHACPECEPARFDGSLVRVPVAEFCGRHKAGRLAFIYRALGITRPSCANR